MVSNAHSGEWTNPVAKKNDETATATSFLNGKPTPLCSDAKVTNRWAGGNELYGHRTDGP